MKKVVEYLGEEVPSLVNFILAKLQEHCAPQALVAALETVLDEEVEPFVVKLWRMLIFSILREDA